MSSSPKQLSSPRQASPATELSWSPPSSPHEQDQKPTKKKAKRKTAQYGGTNKKKKAPAASTAKTTAPKIAKGPAVGTKKWVEAEEERQRQEKASRVRFSVLRREMSRPMPAVTRKLWGEWLDREDEGWMDGEVVRIGSGDLEDLVVERRDEEDICNCDACYAALAEEWVEKSFAEKVARLGKVLLSV